MSLFPSVGGAPFQEHTKKIIRLILRGCANRPFFHISIQEVSKTPQEPVIEQIGNFDPLPNSNNEKLVAINFNRLEYWLRKGAEPTEPVQKLLGLCGYFPVHPSSFRDAYLRRKLLMSELEKLKIEAANYEETMKSTDESSGSLSQEEESTNDFSSISSSSSTSAEEETKSESSSSSSSSAEESTNTVTEKLSDSEKSDDTPEDGAFKK